jgi:hypothetical protein
MLRGKLLFFLVAGLVTVGILSWNIFGQLMDDHKLLGTELAGLVILSFVVFGTIACIFIAMFTEILFHWLEKIADFKRRSGDPRTALKIYEVCLKLDDMLLDNVFRRVIIMSKVSAAFGDLGKQRMARRVSKEAETLKYAEAEKNVDFRNALQTADARAAEAEKERLAAGSFEPESLIEAGQTPASWEMTASDEEYDDPESDEEFTLQTGAQANDSRHGRSWRTRSFQTQPQLAQSSRRAPIEPQPLSQQLPPHVQPSQIRQIPGYAPRVASESVLRLSSVSVAEPKSEPAQVAHRPVVYDSAMKKRLYPEPTPMESRAHHAEQQPAPPKYAGSWLYRYGFVTIFTMVATVYALDGSVRGAASVLLIGVILNAYWLHSNKL